MSTSGREVTSSDHGGEERGRQNEPTPDASDPPVREYLAAGARRGLTIDRMFPDDGMCSGAEPDPGGRPVA